MKTPVAQRYFVSQQDFLLIGLLVFSLLSSTFVLDEFKRKYSNEDTLSVALPYFWEHFDKDGWSLWYAEYRFPEELTQTFMSCNLITGEKRSGFGSREIKVVGT